MRSKSVYCVDCFCGHHIESESTTFTCPECHRVIVIEWSARVEETERSPEVRAPVAA
jgi:predicted RNA-binding Zn-ribbon protein involved in translation (DUF1610 family)